MIPLPKSTETYFRAGDEYIIEMMAIANIEITLGLYFVTCNNCFAARNI